MGFWDFLRSGGSTPIGVMSPHVELVNPDDVLSALADSLAAQTVADLWRTQPHLRTVVAFVARNIAQLGLHSYERVGETDRKRDRTSPAARALAKVDGTSTTYELVFGLVGDLLLYDRAYWWVAPTANIPGSSWMIRRLPPPWVTPMGGDAFTFSKYRVTLNGKVVDLPASAVLPFTGYSPRSASGGSPTIEALRATLSEQIEASKYRGQVWKRGGRVSAVLQRPQDAPAWSDGAREAFREDWYAKYTGDGPRAGGTPILEDGMTLNRVDFSAQEQQFVEAAKLSLSTVAAAFHVNPTMIGVLDNANYSNVREFRKMLYGDTLGPTIAQIEQRLNAFLLPMVGMDEERFYLEFNIAEKLQGNFEEQTQAMSSAVGRPWMTADEARAKLNMPALGGDAATLVTPLNVLVGGQASPRDSAPPKARAKGASVAVKAAATDPQREQAERVVKAFFARQERVIRSALGAKAGEDWWDAERWDGELSDDLHRLALLVSEDVGRKTAESLGFTADDYDVDQTLAYLRAVSDRLAGNINAATKAQIEDALNADDRGDALDSVFTVAQEQRSTSVAAGALAVAASFGTVEAAKQTAGEDRATKTWVTGPKPRPSHAAMNGETVPLSENFSNGLAWPGDAGDADEVAGCNCSLQIDVP